MRDSDLCQPRTGWPAVAGASRRALAAGGLKLLRTGDFKIILDERIDLALWKDNHDDWTGVIQGFKGEIPLELKAITQNWTRINLPVPLSE